jgi:hypothetical protein
MAKRKRTKRQTIINTTLCRKEKIELHPHHPKNQGHNANAKEGRPIPVSLVAHAFLTIW